MELSPSDSQSPKLLMKRITNSDEMWDQTNSRTTTETVVSCPPNPDTERAQALSHRTILKLGGHVQDTITSELKGRISEIDSMQNNFTEIVSSEIRKVKSEMESRYKQLLAQRASEKKTIVSDKWEEKLEAMIELEKEKIHRLEIEWQLRMEDALIKQKEELDQNHVKELEKTAKKVEHNIKADIEGLVAEGVRERLAELEEKQKVKVEQALAEASEKHKADLKMLTEELNSKHQTEISELKTKWAHVAVRYRQLIELSRNVDEDYKLLEQEFKRFVNNVQGAGGPFSTDYLLRSKGHGLMVSNYDPVSFDGESLPKFSESNKRQEKRQAMLNNLTAYINDPSSWPGVIFPKEDTSGNIDNRRVPAPSYLNNINARERFVPVKLVHPQDNDDIGKIILPVISPEETGASYILTIKP